MRKHILIVDDEKWICDSLTNILVHKGFNVHISLTGKGALERLESESCDLMILDYSLPDMDGLDVLKEIRKRDSNLPVIFMTGYGSETVSINAFKLGVSDYFIKPFRPRMMEDSVHEILGSGVNDGLDPETLLPKPVGLKDSVDGSSDVGHAVKYLKENYSSPISLDDIARIACLSRSHFIYKFKKVMGITFKDYLNHLRIKSAEEVLGENDMNVSEVAHSVGFNSLRHFERVFKSVTGKTPLEYRREKYPYISS